MQPLAYPIAEAAKAAGIGRTMMWEAIRTGQLKARKNGAKTIILAEDLTAYLRSLPEVRTAA